MDNIQAPVKGQKPRASWAAAVTNAVNRHERQLSDKAGGDPANKRREKVAAFPWMVVGGTSGGDAKLTIYLPQGSLVVADEEISPADIDGISASDDAADYYTVDDLTDIETSADGAQPLYLVVWRDETQTDPVTAATVTLDPDSISGTVVIQATIALVWASTTEITGDTYGAVAEQIIRSAIIVCNQANEGGSGGSVSGWTGTKHVPYAYDGPRSDGKLYAKTKKWTYENGLLKTISTEDGDDILVADTVAHSGL